MRTIFAFFIFAFFLSSTLLHAAPTIEDYGNLPEVTQVAVSPDGNSIAFRKVNSELDNVYVYSIKEGKHLAALDVSAVKPRYMYFLNNQSLFLIAADHRRLSGFRGKHEINTGFVLDVLTGKVKQLLVPGEGIVYPGQTQLGNVVGVSPDGKEVYMPAYYGTVNYLSGKQLAPPYSLMRVNLKGRSRAKLHKSGDRNAKDFFVTNSGELVAIEIFDQEKIYIRWLPLTAITSGKYFRKKQATSLETLLG